MDDLEPAGFNLLPPPHSPPDSDAVLRSPLPDFDSIKDWVFESPPSASPAAAAVGGEAFPGDDGGREPRDGSGGEHDLVGGGKVGCLVKDEAAGVPVEEMEKVSLGVVLCERERDSSSSSSDDGSSDDDEDSSDSSGTSEEESEDSDDGDEDSEGIGQIDKDSEMEEGEIGGLEASMVAISDGDDEGAVSKVPIKSKNELEILPPVPCVNVILEQHHQMKPVGVILSIVGTKVIVDGKEQHNPLNEGSILWVSESKQPLGYIDEIFGPVKTPFYVVRYNSEKEVPADIHEGTLISFVAEFAIHVLNNKDLYRKGYDASGENDEEISDEAEFSDDDKEAEYRRAKQAGKKGKSNANCRKEDHQSTKRVYGKAGSWKSSRHIGSAIQNNLTQQENPAVSMAGVSFQPQVPPAEVASFESGNLSSHVMQPVGVWPNGVPMQRPILHPTNGIAMVQQPTNQLHQYHQNNLQFPNLGAFPTQFPFQPIGVPPAVPFPFPMGLGLVSPMWPGAQIPPANGAPMATSLPVGRQPPSFQGNVMSTNNFNTERESVQRRNKHFRRGRGGHFSGRRGQ